MRLFFLRPAWWCAVIVALLSLPFALAAALDTRLVMHLTYLVTG
jgi:hypothetical protein